MGLGHFGGVEILREIFFILFTFGGVVRIFDVFFIIFQNFCGNSTTYNFHD